MEINSISVLIDLPFDFRLIYNIFSFSGWVPAGIVVQSGSIETEEFYAGYMSRIEAAEKLKAEKEKGNFVVRKNQKHQFYW